MSYSNPFTPTHSRSALAHVLYACTYSTCSRSRCGESCSPVTERYIHTYSRTWIVRKYLKGKLNRYSLSKVLTIKGAFNGIV